LPEHGEDLKYSFDALAAYSPPDDDPVFCHGDFVCSQMLVDPARWSLLDFDLCRSGSRYRDLAILLASLPSDAGCFSAAMMDDPCLMAAESGFIAAYAAQSGLTINHQALTWHRICAELHYMMLMLKKNRFTQARFAGGLRRLRLLCTGLDRVAS
jgi:aminoglycoside phosphotransferase (APT) family kinase protein